MEAMRCLPSAFPALAFLGILLILIPSLGGLVTEAAERETKPGSQRKAGEGGAEKKKATKTKARKPVQERVEAKPIDVGDVWRQTEVFSEAQLVKLAPILRASTCTKEKVGCTYLDDGRAGSEASFAFRLIPWKVSKHRSYLVHNDRCAPGGCDQGLFIQIDGRWRLVTEMFGILQRQGKTTLGFEDLVAYPRGQPPVTLVWDGQAYREAGR